MAELPPHHCPGCGAEQRPNSRYPWSFCHTCLGKAETGSGAKLGFGNSSLGGGLDYWLADQPQARVSARRVLCHILGRPVQVGEARFGGVVAEPLTSPPPYAKGTTDLRGS